MGSYCYSHESHSNHGDNGPKREAQATDDRNAAAHGILIRTRIWLHESGLSGVGKHGEALLEASRNQCTSLCGWRAEEIVNARRTATKVARQRKPGLSSTIM